MLLFFQTKNQKEKIKSTRQQVTEYWTMWGLFQKTQENLKKNGFFRTILAILWSKQPSLVKNWTFLAKFCHLWSKQPLWKLTIFGYFAQNSSSEIWPFLAVCGHFWPFLSFWPCPDLPFCLLVKTAKWIWLFLAIFRRFWPTSPGFTEKTIHTEEFLPIKTYYPDKKCIL